MNKIVNTDNVQDWRIYTGISTPHTASFPPPPPWRTFSKYEGKDPQTRGTVFQVSETEINLVNAALILRRPLLITGKPGSGKSSLAYSVARELQLGPVLRWPITSRTTLADGLYRYDAIGRLQDASLKQRKNANDTTVPDIGQYIQLGPLGNAFLSKDQPRVLLIDEIDKSDIDLPNDLLNIFEEGAFEIPELRRMAINKEASEVKVFSGFPTSSYEEDDNWVSILDGVVHCTAFPFVVLTSNGEREFPPAFLRRCIRLEIEPPDPNKLSKIVEAHLGPEVSSHASGLIEDFIKKREDGYLAVDQLLNAIYLFIPDREIPENDRKTLSDALLQYLNRADIS